MKGPERSGQVGRAGGAGHSPKKGGRWATASRKGPVSICRSAGSGLSRCSASSAISGSRPLVMPQPAPRASAPGLSPPAASRDASVATSARASQRAPSAARRPEPWSARPRPPGALPIGVHGRAPLTNGSPSPPPPHCHWSGGGAWRKRGRRAPGEPRPGEALHRPPVTGHLGPQPGVLAGVALIPTRLQSNPPGGALFPNPGSSKGRRFTPPAAAAPGFTRSHHPTSLLCPKTQSSVHPTSLAVESLVLRPHRIFKGPALRGCCSQCWAPRMQ